MENAMNEYTVENKTGLMEQIQHYWLILLKWKWIALFFLFIAVSGAILFSVLITPVFTASGSVWIEDNPNI